MQPEDAAGRLAWWLKRFTSLKFSFMIELRRSGDAGETKLLNSIPSEQKNGYIICTFTSLLLNVHLEVQISMTQWQ